MYTISGEFNWFGNVIPRALDYLDDSRALCMTWGMITDSVCCVCVCLCVCMRACVCVSPSVYACIYVTGPDKTSLIYTKYTSVLVLHVLSSFNKFY